MKLSLEDAYARATKGPLELFGAGNCLWLHAQRDPSKPERIPQREVALMRDEGDGQMYPTAALLAHYWNTHGELVKAAETFTSRMSDLLGKVDDFIVDAMDSDIQAMREVLAKASTVEVLE